MARPFIDRTTAGQALAEKLHRYADRSDVVVLALPRGGAPVASEVALMLRAPLDVFVVRKLGVPGHPELAMGAIASGGIRVKYAPVIKQLGIPDDVVDLVAMYEERELERRESAYRGFRPALDVKDKIVILIDDGLATGSTMRAAITALKLLDPARIVVAVPAGAADSCSEIGEEVDEIICALTPEPFRAVGLWYEDFSQISDEEV